MLPNLNTLFKDLATITWKYWSFIELVVWYWSYPKPLAFKKDFTMTP